MADLRRHMKYPWLESTLSTFWSLKYTPTPLSVFFILFDVIRKDFMHDSHASQGWLACLARLTCLARMPHTSDSLASHASHGWLACLACLAHYTNSTHCSFNRMHFQPPILFPCILYKRVSGVAEIHSSIFFHSPFPEARPQSNNGNESCPFSATYLISLYSLKDSKLSCWKSFILLLSLQSYQDHILASAVSGQDGCLFLRSSLEEIVVNLSIVLYSVWYIVSV